MDYEFVDGKLRITRSDEERAPLVLRLKRVEGQVRGLRQMIEENRYCLDEVQQANAITAAVREVMLLVISQHLQGGVDYAVRSGNCDAAVLEMISVLRAGLRQ